MTSSGGEGATRRPAGVTVRLFDPTDLDALYAIHREVMREYVEAMRALWSQDEASYAGEFVSFGPSWAWPKPVRPSGPPVLVGAAVVVELCLVIWSRLQRPLPVAEAAPGAPGNTQLLGEVLYSDYLYPVEVAAGVNPIGGTACGPAFTGELLAVTWGQRPRSP